MSELTDAIKEVYAAANRRARQFQRMARKLGKMIPPDEVGFTRASGLVICEECELRLYDHPRAKDSTLVIGCDGRQYHL